MFKKTIALSILGAALVSAAPASAGTGCNGVISPTEWGCAPWDNNNGPQYPHYRKPSPGPRPNPGNSPYTPGRNGSLIGSDSAGLIGKAR